MPFIEASVSEQIEAKRKADPDFKKAWDIFQNEESGKVPERGYHTIFPSAKNSERM